jgi:hypothetical protein
MTWEPRLDMPSKSLIGWIALGIAAVAVIDVASSVEGTAGGIASTASTGVQAVTITAAGGIGAWILLALFP